MSNSGAGGRLERRQVQSRSVGHVASGQTELVQKRRDRRARQVGLDAEQVANGRGRLVVVLHGWAAITVVPPIRSATWVAP